MDRLYKSGEITKHIHVTAQTIRRWVNRFPSFFSETATSGGNREIAYTVEDIALIGTIHYLSSMGRALDEIEKDLRNGFRHDDGLLETIENKLFMPKGDRSIEAGGTANLAQALEAIQRLEEKNETLLREIADLKFELGMTKGELNLLRRQLEQS